MSWSTGRARSTARFARRNDLDRSDRYEPHQLDQVLTAVDTLVDWTVGRSVSTEALTDAFRTLEPVVRRSPLVATREGEIDHGQWNELVGPGAMWLREHGLDRAAWVARHAPEPTLGC